MRVSDRKAETLSSSPGRWKSGSCYRNEGGSHVSIPRSDQSLGPRCVAVEATSAQAGDKIKPKDLKRSYGQLQRHGAAVRPSFHSRRSGK